MAKQYLKSANILTMLLLVAMNFDLQAAYTASVIAQTAFDNTTTNVVWENTNTGFPVDDDQQQVPIGFNFSFGGVTYTQTRIISNGALHFGADQAVHQTFNNTALATGAGDRLILPYWDDLDPSIGGTVTYGTFGTAPNRRFAATWITVPRYNQPFTSHTFQVVLYESGNILYRYGNDNANGSSATIGIEEDNADFTQFSFNSVSVSDTQDILWIPELSAIDRIESDCLSTMQISIIFDAPVTSGVVDDIANYAINNGITINSATIVNPTTVQLTTSAFTLGTTYTLQSVNPSQTVNFIFGAATFADLFDSASYNNNDGSNSWTGTWIENQEQGGGGGPLAGNITITGSQLRMDDRPNTNGEPNLYREVDLSGFTSATLTFDYQTSANLENSDRFDIDISSNGGASYTTVQTFSNDANGTLTVDLTPYIASNTRIRFLVENNYGGPNEAMFIDNVQIVAIPDASACLANVDHYSITHSTQGVTCQAEPITVTGHDASDVAVSPSASTTITLSTSIANDGWALNSGNGTFIPPNQYTFDGTETTVIFWLTKTTATIAPHIDIDVSDGSASDLDDGGSEDLPISFADSGFRFYADTVYDAIGTQVAGKASDIAPGSQTLTIESVITDTNTGACAAGITGQQTVQMAFECVDPSSCKTANGVTIVDAVSAISSTAGDNPLGSSSNTNDVELTFDSNGIATWTMTYFDAGEIRLHAMLDIPFSDPNPAFSLTGSTSPIVSVPAGFCVSSPDVNAECPNPPSTSYSGCTILASAGSPFNLDIRAVAWESAGETNTQFCSGNSTTANFQLNNLAVTQNLIAPSPGNVGVAGTTSVDIVDADNGDHNINNQTTSEVGVFSYTVTPPVYFGETIAPSTSDDIGRFIPDHFALSSPVIVNRSDFATCVSAFTYMGENFDLSYDLSAMSVGAANVTQNYTTTSGFAKLDSTELNYAAADISIPTDLSSRLQTGTPSVNFTAGVATLSHSVSLDRQLSGIADGPYALSVGIAPVDDDSVAIDSFDLDVDAATSPGNDHRLIGATNLNYGRAVLENTFGSELITLDMPMKVEFYDGINFVTNSADMCTVFAATDLILSNNIESGQIDTDIQVLGGQTSIATVANNPVILGDANLSFCPPGSPACTPTSGNGGFIDVQINLSPTGLDYPWLQFDWDGDGLDNDPTATATFGIYKGNDVNIYIQQVYQ